MKAIQVSGDSLLQKWPPGSLKHLHVLRNDSFYVLFSDGSGLTDNTVGFLTLYLLT